MLQDSIWIIDCRSHASVTLPFLYIKCIIKMTKTDFPKWDSSVVKPN